MVKKQSLKLDSSAKILGTQIYYCEYRPFFPAELEHLLGEKGFQVVGMFDNKEMEESDLSGEWLYVAARFR